MKIVCVFFFPFDSLINVFIYTKEVRFDQIYCDFFILFFSKLSLYMDLKSLYFWY